MSEATQQPATTLSHALEIRLAILRKLARGALTDQQMLALDRERSKPTAEAGDEECRTKAQENQKASQ